MAQNKAPVGPDRSEVGNAYVPAYCTECRAPAKREPLSGVFSIKHRDDCTANVTTFVDLDGTEHPVHWCCPDECRCNGNV